MKLNICSILLLSALLKNGNCGGEFESNLRGIQVNGKSELFKEDPKIFCDVHKKNEHAKYINDYLSHFESLELPYGKINPEYFLTLIKNFGRCETEIFFGEYLVKIANVSPDLITKYMNYIASMHTSNMILKVMEVSSAVLMELVEVLVVSKISPELMGSLLTAVSLFPPNIATATEFPPLYKITEQFYKHYEQSASFEQLIVLIRHGQRFNFNKIDGRDPFIQSAVTASNLPYFMSNAMENMFQYGGYEDIELFLSRNIFPIRLADPIGDGQPECNKGIISQLLLNKALPDKDKMKVLQLLLENSHPELPLSCYFNRSTFEADKDFIKLGMSELKYKDKEQQKWFKFLNKLTENNPQRLMNALKLKEEEFTKSFEAITFPKSECTLEIMVPLLKEAKLDEESDAKKDFCSRISTCKDLSPEPKIIRGASHLEEYFTLLDPATQLCEQESIPVHSINRLRSKHSFDSEKYTHVKMDVVRYCSQFYDVDEGMKQCFPFMDDSKFRLSEFSPHNPNAITNPKYTGKTEEARKVELYHQMAAQSKC